MSRLHVHMRDIGSVKVFDLVGEPNPESLQEVAWQIQRSIRRHRLQRVILNLQKIQQLDELGTRKLVAAFLRPQRSAIYGATHQVQHLLEDTYLPENIKICPTEKEVAENLGPFLFEKDHVGKILGEEIHASSLKHQGPGTEMERRRSKRMHVAIPLDISLQRKEGTSILTRGIATNISDGGIFVEYLDLDALTEIEKIATVEGLPVEIQIHPSANFPEEYQLEGVVLRKEVHKRGLGLAITFKPRKQ